MAEQCQDDSDDDDCDYVFSDEETNSDNGLEGFDDIEMGELQNSRDPFFLNIQTEISCLPSSPWMAMFLTLMPTNSNSQKPTQQFNVGEKCQRNVKVVLL